MPIYGGIYLADNKLRNYEVWIIVDMYVETRSLAKLTYVM